MEVRFIRSRTLLAFLLAFCVRETRAAHSGRPGLRGLPCYALLPSVALSLHIQLDAWTSSLLGLRKGPSPRLMPHAAHSTAGADLQAPLSTLPPATLRPEVARPRIDDVAVMRESGDVDLACVHAGLELRADLCLPRYSLIAHNHVVSEEDLREVLANFRQTLLGEELFTVYWDLREVKLPSRKTIRVGVEWMGEPEHAKALDTKVKGVAVVVKGSVVRTVASWVLSVCKPPCPVCICRTPDDALSFARSIGPAAATTEAEFGRKLS
ncbi:hypothetical protein AB1Y20_007452 [Prymnesium parvum]|uniref:Uncharacterized protein n=1 Tax=Prymnesium parvum TaxID=97485 RepID=A0AB34IXX1_PRYPA